MLANLVSVRDRVVLDEMLSCAPIVGSCVAAVSSFGNSEIVTPNEVRARHGLGAGVWGEVARSG